MTSIFSSLLAQRGRNVGLDEAEFLASFPLKGAGRARFIGTVKREAEARRDLTFDDISRHLINHLDTPRRRLREAAFFSEELQEFTCLSR